MIEPCRTTPVAAPEEHQAQELPWLERVVVALAVDEARRGIAPAGTGPRLRRLADLLLGRRQATPLADPRLDRLYRFAHAAARGCERLADFGRMREDGFSLVQAVLVAQISRR